MAQIIGCLNHGLQGLKDDTDFLMLLTGKNHSYHQKICEIIKSV